MNAMPTGTNNPPDVPVGSGSDPSVTFYHPNGMWITQQVNDPTNLLNSQYIVQRINGDGICSDWYTVLYQITAQVGYPTCGRPIGFFNDANREVSYPDTGSPPRVNYHELEYGSCPGGVYHFLNDAHYLWTGQLNTWDYEYMVHCWPGWNDKGNADDGTARYTFPNGITVGWCCMKP